MNEYNHHLEDIYIELKQSYQKYKDDKDSASLCLLPLMIIIKNTLNIGFNNKERTLSENYYSPFATKLFICYFYARFIFLYKRFLFEKNLYAIDNDKAIDIVKDMRELIFITISRLNINKETFLELSTMFHEDFGRESFGDELDKLGFYAPTLQITQSIEHDSSPKYINQIQNSFKNFDIIAKDVIDGLIIQLTY